MSSRTPANHKPPPVIPAAEHPGFRSILDDVRKLQQTPPRVGTPQRRESVQLELVQPQLSTSPAVATSNNNNSSNVVSGNNNKWGSSQRIRSPLNNARRAVALTPIPSLASPVKQQQPPQIATPSVSRTPDPSTSSNNRKNTRKRTTRRTRARTTVLLDKNQDDDENNNDDDVDPQERDHILFNEESEEFTSNSAVSQSRTQQQQQQQQQQQFEQSLLFASQNPHHFSVGTPMQRLRRADTTAAVNTSVFMLRQTTALNSDAAMPREKLSRRGGGNASDMFKWGADAPREWTEQEAKFQQINNSNGNVSPASIHHHGSPPPPYVSNKVKEIFFWLKRELAGAEFERHQLGQAQMPSSSGGSSSGAAAALSALEQLCEATPVLKPVIDIAVQAINGELTSFRQRLDAARTSTRETAMLQHKLNEQMTRHYTEVLQERQRTKSAQDDIKRIQDKYSNIEEAFTIKLIDAQAEGRMLEVELKERTQEVAELREALAAVMSVRRQQQQHVEEVEARANKVITESEREVAVINEDLETKNDTIRQLEKQIEGERMLAKKEFDEYAKKALPPVKSAALRAEADRYKNEVAKLKDKVERLQAELLRREAYEPAVEWEEFVDDKTMLQLCQVCDVPQKIRKDDGSLVVLSTTAGSTAFKAGGGSGDNDDDGPRDEEDEEELQKLTNRSKAFSQHLFRMWQSVLSLVDRYNAERDLFEKMSRVMLDIGIPLELLPAHHGDPLAITSHESSSPPSSAAVSAASSRLQLDSPPIDSASPEPWIDPAWVGCYVQPPPVLPSALDSPIIAQAEHRFRITNVLIPPCLMHLSTVRAVLVSALVLLGLNRVPDIDNDWHPARQFAHAVRVQLEAAVNHIRALASHEAAALAQEQIALQSSNVPPSGADAASGTPLDALRARRRRFEIPNELDSKSTTAACMAVLYHRLAQCAPTDPFTALCLSFFLGKRPVLLHARYFALTLRSACQFFARVEKMWRSGSTPSGTLPKSLMVHCLRPAFAVRDMGDLTRLTVSLFHTHYWTQVQEMQQSQVPATHDSNDDHNHPGGASSSTTPQQQQHATAESAEVAAALKRIEAATVKVGVDGVTERARQQQQQQSTIDPLATRVLTSWLDASDISYKTLFGTLRAGDASPLLLQLCHLYATDVVHCEGLMTEAIVSFAKAGLVTRWTANEGSGFVERWMLKALFEEDSNKRRGGGSNNNDNSTKNCNDDEDVDGATSSQGFTPSPHSAAGALGTWQQSLVRGFVPDSQTLAQQQEGGGATTTAAAVVEPIDDLAASASGAHSAAAGGGVGTVAEVANQQAHLCVARLTPLFVSGMFDPSDALRFETVLSHLPARPAVGFEDTLSSPMQGPEPKYATAANAGPAPPVALATLSAHSMSESGHFVTTSELQRNLLHSQPWHPRLLLQVATGSWFLIDTGVAVPAEAGLTAGCAELSNEQASALSRAAASPDVKKDKKRGGGGRAK